MENVIKNINLELLKGQVDTLKSIINDGCKLTKEQACAINTVITGLGNAQNCGTVSIFRVMTQEKEDSLGEMMKLKDLLDKGWNKVDVESDDGNGNEMCEACYLNFDGTYEVGAYDDSILNEYVVVSTFYDTDDDNYPIVKAELLTSYLYNICSIPDRYLIESKFGVSYYTKDDLQYFKNSGMVKEDLEELTNFMEPYEDDCLFKVSTMTYCEQNKMVIRGNLMAFPGPDELYDDVMKHLKENKIIE